MSTLLKNIYILVFLFLFKRVCPCIYFHKYLITDRDRIGQTANDALNFVIWQKATIEFTLRDYLRASCLFNVL